MNFLSAVFLGIIQGLTEFIPVSSTGHLILFRELMNMEVTGTLAFDAVLQLATALAVLIYFWRDLWNIFKNRDFKLIFILIIGTIPAMFLGLFLEDLMDTKLRSTFVVAISLISGSVLFYLVEKFYKQKLELNYKSALIIGLFQCFALVPGFSRSGATISGGLFMGLKREVAIRFSFLLSLPIILGSGLKKILDLSQINEGLTLIDVGSPLLIASIFAFISGLLAINFLLKFLKNHSLNYFGIYRLILAFIILIWL